MKKIFVLLFLILILFGCSSEDAEYVGRYAILTKEKSTSLVVVWEYPTEDFEFHQSNIDISNLEDYIDEDFDNSGSGVVLNSLLGNLGFNRKFLTIQPININEEDVKTIIRKNIPIYLEITDQNEVSYHVKLKYDKSIKE